MQALDRRAIDAFGVPGLVLMENAGRACADVVSARVPGDGRVVVLCGTGNNGGDGFVVARHLHCRGVAVQVVLAGDGAAVRDDARVNLRALERLPVPLHVVAEEPLPAAVEALFAAPAVVVDALFGTGLRSEPRGVARALIARANASAAWRLAVDIPSGVHGADGHVPGEAFRAHRTVTFALPKVGLLVYPGAAYVGELTVADITIPPAAVAEADLPTSTVERAEAAGLFAARRPDAHKGHFGHVLVVAGSTGKAGAALLAAAAALRAGAGLVTVATDGPTQARIEGRMAEVMVEAVRADADAPPDPARLGALLAGKSAVAFGPGLGATPATFALLQAVLGAAHGPVVIDADGLNVLAGRLAELPDPRPPLVLTPHPGEAGRLVGVGSAAIQRDRLGHARDLARRSGAIVVLKGARTVVAEPQGQVGLVLGGNPGMATAGSGDVLTGILAAVLAQGLAPWPAARVAAWLHAEAGDRVAERQGEAGLIAGDLVAELPSLLRDLRTPSCPRAA